MIRGQTRTLETPEIKTKLNASIHNRFDIEVIDSKTGKIRQKAFAENVILDQMWTYMLSPSEWNKYIQYGTGTGTPNASDTALFSYYGYGTPSTDNDVYVYDEENKTASVRRQITLSETTAVGVTITEVGIARYTTSGLCTHAMLQDMNGNQISITKTDTDIINIYATIFAHVSLLSQNNVFVGLCTGEGDGFWPTSLIEFMLGLQSNISFVTSYLLPSGTSTLSTNCLTTYDASTKSITTTLTRLAATSGNGYNGFLCLRSYDALQFYFPNSAFSGSTIVGEALGTGDGSTSDFITDFSYVDSATVYIDGVETANVTVDTNKPFSGSDSCWALQIIQGSFVGLSIGKYKTKIFYNPYYTNYGYASFTTNYNTDLYCSNDLINWVEISLSTTVHTIPAAYQNYKYWKFIDKGVCSYGYGATLTNAALNVDVASNIHFATPPADGAVLTIDYTSKTIAKDENHVFDFSFVITFNEYTE